MADQPWTNDSQFLTTLGERLARFAASRGMRERADDIVQESMLRLLSREDLRARPKEEASPISFGIVRNVIREGWRPPKAEGFSEGFDPPDGRPGVDESMLAREHFRHVRAGLLKLGTKCQQIIKQRLKGVSSREIGALFGMSEGAVNVHFHRCCKQWRQNVAEAR